MPAATPDMLVVLDGHPTCRGPLSIAQRYASATAILAGWETADTLQFDGEVVESTGSQPSVVEALRCAAEHRIGFVGLRRDLAPPRELLTELLQAAAPHTDADLPGFAVFLTGSEPAAFRRILAIVDQRTGSISGLGANAAVAVAVTAGAALDVIVVGADDQALPDDEVDLLRVGHERELFAGAVQRMRSSGLPLELISVTCVDDLWSVVGDQLRHRDYDLVVDDLGDVDLGRPVQRRRASRAALEPGQVGEVPLRLLSETSLPLLLIVDRIRLGTAPVALLRGVTVAALALGMITASRVPKPPDAPVSVSSPTVSPGVSPSLTSAASAVTRPKPPEKPASKKLPLARELPPGADPGREDLGPPLT